jgi:SprB repeat
VSRPRQIAIRLSLAALCAIALLTSCPVNFYGSLDNGAAGSTGSGGTSQTIALGISPSAVTLSTSSSITFSAIGGVPPYSYSIASGGGSINSGTGVYTAPGVAGTAKVRVTDAAAGTSQATVNAVSPLTISPTAVSMYTGTSYTFNAVGGNPPYTFLIVSGGGTIDSSGKYTAPGTPGSALVQVKDSSSSTSNASVTITSPPSPLAITPASVSLQTNSSPITLTASGGVPSYTFSLSGGGVLSGATSTTVTYTPPPSAGSATVQVLDNVSSTASASITITPASSGLTISPASVQIVAGGTASFTAAGGTLPYSYSVSGSGTINPTTGLYTAPASAPAAATVKVTDSATPTPATSSAVVNIVPPPLSIAPRVAYVPISAGTTFSASGGTPPYTFSLVSGGGSVNYSTGVYSAPNTPGSASVKVTDSTAPTPATSNASITIYNPFAIVPPSLVIYTSTQYGFSATGGIPPYRFSVTSGAGSIDPSTGVYSAPSSPASGVAVQAADSIGNTSTSSVTVAPPVVTWIIQSVSLGSGSKPGPYSSLVIDSSGAPQVAYHDSQGPGSLKYTSSFTMPVVVDGTHGSGQYVSLALDSSGNPHVSYYDAGGKTLRFNSSTGTTWGTPQIPDATTDDVGSYCSIALDSSRLAHISYYDATTRTLKYVAQTGASTWAAPQVVDAGNGGTFDVGQYSSIALDTSGLAHISYYDNTNHVLKYIVQTSPTTWGAAQIVDSAGDVGKYSDSVLDSSGYGRISYYDATIGRLKYARQTGPSTWNIVVVDAAGNVGQYTSIAIDSSGNPRIAYYDATNTNLKCAFGFDPDGSTWDLQTADTGGTWDVGSYASISLDPSSQKVRITYYDATAPALKYAVQQ